MIESIRVLYGMALGFGQIIVSYVSSLLMQLEMLPIQVLDLQSIMRMIFHDLY